jgi:hypothetical protein
VVIRVWPSDLVHAGDGLQPLADSSFITRGPRLGNAVAILMGRFPFIEYLWKRLYFSITRCRHVCFLVKTFLYRRQALLCL